MIRRLVLVHFTTDLPDVANSASIVSVTFNLCMN